MAQTDHNSGPSQTARMVCEEADIGDAVRRAFQMSFAPTSSHSWRQNSRTYTCRWVVPHGTLVMTVQDAVDEGAGRSYYRALMRRLDHPRPIRGMANFGFSALQTARGDVVFLKDGKTLHVDATHLPGASLPRTFSHEDVAYAVAAAVIACWTE